MFLIFYFKFFWNFFLKILGNQSQIKTKQISAGGAEPARAEASGGEKPGTRDGELLTPAGTTILSNKSMKSKKNEPKINILPDKAKDKKRNQNNDHVSKKKTLWIKF